MSGTARSWRQRTLAMALAATLALSVVAALKWPAAGGGSAHPDDVVSAPARAAPATAHAGSAPAPAPASPAAPRIELEHFKQHRRPGERDRPVRNAFAAAAWGVPAAAQAPASRAPAVKVERTVPPVPFQFLGRYEDRGAASVVLLMGERVYIVSPGQVIDGTWRVDRLGPTELEVTYLPLHARQTMSTGE